MTLPRLIVVLLMTVVVACGGSNGGGANNNPSLDNSAQGFTYRALTDTDIRAIQTSWGQRDLSVRDLTLAYEDIQPSYHLRIYRHRVGANLHYGAIVTPSANPAKPLPVLVLPDGLNQADPSMTVENNLRGYRSDSVLVLPAFRGRTLRYKNQNFYAEGDFCDAYDGATDDTIALLNVVAATTPMANMDGILVAGYSRGGNVAVLLAERDVRVDTAIAGAAPVDFYRQSVRALYTTQYDCQFFANKTPDQARERMLASSPLHFQVLPSVKKVYLLHGGSDNIVPLWNAQEMNNRLVAQRVDVSLYQYDGFGHSDIWNNQNFANAWSTLQTEFIASH